jgi:hypothetical protein
VWDNTTGITGIVTVCALPRRLAVNELPAPPDVVNDPDAVELLRVWVVQEALHCSLQADAFPEAGTWGVVLADVVRYVASALKDQEGIAPEETTQRILAVFQEELGSSAGADTGAPPAE